MPPRDAHMGINLFNTRLRQRKKVIATYGLLAHAIGVKTKALKNVHKKIAYVSAGYLRPCSLQLNKKTFSETKI